MYSLEKQSNLLTSTKKILKSENITKDYIEELKEIIKYHEWNYYVNDNPLISDREYDILFSKLIEIETDYPELLSNDSPSQRVGSDVVNKDDNITHLVPMLSLENSYNENDLIEFDKRIKKLTEAETIEYVIEPKLDGGSIAIVYENDILIRAATRGDGQKGEEITQNIKTIRSIPIHAKFSKYGIYRVELRGEAVIKKSDFIKINKDRLEKSETLFANPRNAATGGIRTKDPKSTKERKINAFIYQMAVAEDKNGESVLSKFNNHQQSIEILETLGFKIPKTISKVASNINEVIDHCFTWSIQRDSYDYEIDGLVIKVNDKRLQDLCGYTSHHPRWAIAYKFAAKQATTTLIDVEFQIGKIGSISPVAKLEPVELAGVTISSVSLHNEEFIQQRDLRIGDKVLVERAGDVIPYIVKAFPEYRNGHETKITFPKYCPNKHEKPVELIKFENESAWRCPICKDDVNSFQRILFFTSKSGMDIEGFGKAYVEKFYDSGWLKNFADVYQLPYDKIKNLDGFGDKSIENLIKSIEKSKERPLAQLIQSLSIHHVGKKIASIVANKVKHILELKDLTLEELESTDEIGPIVAKNIHSFFSNEENIALIKNLEKLGLNMKNEVLAIEYQIDHPLYLKTILFTGTLSDLGRNQAEEIAKEKGAVIASSVSKNLHFLVAGEKAGSKLEKAKKLGSVKIISEKEFLEML